MRTPVVFPLSAGLRAALGAPFEALCAQAGAAPDGGWSTQTFFRLWTAAEGACSDPDAGLRLGAEGLARGYSLAGLVALHASDFGAALQALSRYKRLTCPEVVEVERAGDEAVVRYRWLLADQAPPRLLVDMTLASLRQLAHEGSGGRITPLRVELARSTGPSDALVRRLGCPVIFEAVSDALVFPAAALDEPFVTADRPAFARVVEDLEPRFRAGEGVAGLVGETRVAIARRLGGGRPVSVAAVARALALSGRTLQRRLAAEGARFQDELAAVRRITAQRLLAETRLDPTAIALLLGFAEPNSFARAWRRWEQTSPARWRARHGVQGARP